MLTVRTRKKYKTRPGTAGWRGLIEVYEASAGREDWMMTVEVGLMNNKDGTGTFVTYPQRKMPDGTYFDMVRGSSEMSDRITAAIKADPDPAPRMPSQQGTDFPF